jgi:hypothetical protein
MNGHTLNCTRHNSRVECYCLTADHGTIIRKRISSAESIAPPQLSLLLFMMSPMRYHRQLVQWGIESTEKYPAIHRRNVLNNGLKLFYKHGQEDQMLL